MTQMMAKLLYECNLFALRLLSISARGRAHVLYTLFLNNTIISIRGFQRDVVYSLLTNSALVIRVQMRGSCGVSAIQLCTSYDTETR
jgi:hypothetical protein